MSTELIINATLPETRIALLENNEIQELHIERDSERGIVGNIYKGKVLRVLPGMQACFVDIGMEKAAFLYVDDIFFPDMKTPLQTAALPETAGQVAGPAPISVSPSTSIPTPNVTPAVTTVTPVNPTKIVVPPSVQSADRGGRGRDRGRGREQRGPVKTPLPGSPEAHAAAQAAYARQMLDHDEETDGPAPQKPVPPVAPIAAAADPTSTAPMQDQPAARAPEPAVVASTVATAEEDDEDEVEGETAYRPEPLIDTAAWEEDLTPEEPEEAVAEGAAAPAPDAVVEAAPVEAAPVVAEGAPAPVAPVVVPEVKGPAPVIVSPVRPVGVDEEDEDEETSEMPRRRRRREPVNIADIIKEGQDIVVQVAKDPIGTKGARLTCHVSLPGRYLVFMPTVDHIGVSRRIEGEGERRRLKETMNRIRPSKTGVIVRTASGKQTDLQLKQDLDYLVTTWNDIQKKFNRQRAGTTVYQDLTIVLRAIRDMFTDEVDKVVVDSGREHKAIMKFVTRFIPQVKDKVELYQGDMPIFDMYGIETEITRALERKVWLKSGGYLVVDQAEALVAIDVNTGRYVGKKTLEETILKTNLEAVVEIAYQLRLRNYGGIIILDLIDMEKEANKEKVYKALEEALKGDRARPTILKISQLGLIEMTRKRTRDSMVRSLCEPCVNCEGKGFVKNKLTIAYDIMRDIEREIGARENLGLSIQCHPSVADVLLEDKRDVLEDIERQFNKKLAVRGNGAYHVEQYELIAQRETKNVVWSSEERRQIVKSRVQERVHVLAAEGRRQAEVDRQERRRIDEERRREQDRVRAERRAEMEERRRQAAAIREAARVAALAAAQSAAEEQVRARLTEQGVVAESPEWQEQFTAGVSAIMAVFQAQQLPIPVEPEIADDGLEEGGSDRGAGGGGDQSRRRRRGRRGRGGGSARDGRDSRDSRESRGGRGGRGGGGGQQQRVERTGPPKVVQVTPVSNPGAGSGPMPMANAGGSEAGAGPAGDAQSPDAGGGPEGAGGGAGDPRRRRRRGRRGGRWRKRPGGKEAGGPGGEPSGGGGGGEMGGGGSEGGGGHEGGGHSGGGGGGEYRSQAPAVSAAPPRGNGGGSDNEG